MASQDTWQFWIDRGGTFTDVVGRKPDGSLLTYKLLSENPEQYKDAAVAGIRHLLGVAKDEPLPVERIDAVKMASMNAVEDLTTYQDFSQANLDGLKNLISSFKTLYDSMPADQKKNADGVFDSYGPKPAQRG